MNLLSKFPRRVQLCSRLSSMSSTYSQIPDGTTTAVRSVRWLNGNPPVPDHLDQQVALKPPAGQFVVVRAVVLFEKRNSFVDLWHPRCCRRYCRAWRESRFVLPWTLRSVSGLRIHQTAGSEPTVLDILVAHATMPDFPLFDAVFPLFQYCGIRYGLTASAADRAVLVEFRRLFAVYSIVATTPVQCAVIGAAT